MYGFETRIFKRCLIIFYRNHIFASLLDYAHSRPDFKTHVSILLACGKRLYDRII